MLLCPDCGSTTHIRNLVEKWKARISTRTYVESVSNINTNHVCKLPFSVLDAWLGVAFGLKAALRVSV